MEKHEEKITKEKVLALDIATHCGYHSAYGGGTWNFTESMRRNNNKQHKAFRDTLINFIEAHDIKMIVAEDVSVNSHFTDCRKLSEFRGILLEVCDTLGLPEPAFVNPTTIKKWATGDGRADKAKMMEYCKKRWGVDAEDDNHSDATHIYMYYVIKYNL